jgi:26S proteasome regulatory subunit N3
MDVDSASSEKAAETAEAVEEPPRTSVLPEVEVYLSLLVLTTLLRTPAVPPAACVAAAEALANRASAYNRRSLDGLRAKAFHFLSLAHERNGTMAQLRPRLLAAHRTACLQVTLNLNLF